MIHPAVFTIIVFSLILKIFFPFPSFFSPILLLTCVEVNVASQTSNEKFLCKDIIFGLLIYLDLNSCFH